MQKINTSVGTMYVRNDWDKAVIHEVIENDEYSRWGNIIINPGDMVMDCGAHIGSFTRLALSLGAKVLAIEADRDNFEMLKLNTIGYNNLILYNAIIYDGKPVPFLKDPERGELHKIAAVSPDIFPSTTLKRIIKQFKIEKIDLLKMDIEGSEYEVLYHFKQFEIVRQISMEWHYGASNMAKLIIFLEKKGFKTVWLGGNGNWGKLQMKRI